MRLRGYKCSCVKFMCMDESIPTRKAARQRHQGVAHEFNDGGCVACPWFFLLCAIMVTLDTEQPHKDTFLLQTANCEKGRNSQRKYSQCNAAYGKHKAAKQNTSQKAASKTAQVPG